MKVSVCLSCAKKYVCDKFLKTKSLNEENSFADGCIYCGEKAPYVLVERASGGGIIEKSTNKLIGNWSSNG